MELIFLSMLFLIVLVTAVLWIKLVQTNKRVELELDQAVIEPLVSLGTVDKLVLLPLVEYYAAKELASEAGVSYLIRAGSTTLLLDVGANEKKAHPSALVSNMQALGVDPMDFDGIVISHFHRDHVGGIKEERRKEFSLSRGLIELPQIPVWAPGKIYCSKYNSKACPENVTAPLLLDRGIALTGPLPSSLFGLGYTLEQCLVFNVKNKGLVVVIGCGHPTVRVILDRVRKMFDQPVYGIIGGLHLPVLGGRMNFGPLNLQNLVGSNRMPWHCLNKRDVYSTIEIIKKESPEFVALSPHDSSDWAIDQFRQAFGSRYHSLEAGKALEI